MIFGLDIAIKSFFKMAAVRHLEFSKFGILLIGPVSDVTLLLRARFRVNLTINRSDIPKKRFSVWRPAAILDLQNFDILRRGCY